MAPELVQERPYNYTTDLWSLGVILYELYTGKPPFYTNSIYTLIHLIVEDTVKYPSNMSSPFKSFLQGLLQKQPNKRLKWPELAYHEFLANHTQQTNTLINNKPVQRLWLSQPLCESIDKCTLINTIHNNDNNTSSESNYSGILNDTHQEISQTIECDNDDNIHNYSVVPPTSSWQQLQHQCVIDMNYSHQLTTNVHIQTQLCSILQQVDLHQLINNKQQQMDMSSVIDIIRYTCSMNLLLDHIQSLSSFIDRACQYHIQQHTTNHYTDVISSLITQSIQAIHHILSSNKPFNVDLCNNSYYYNFIQHATPLLQLNQCGLALCEYYVYLMHNVITHSETSALLLNIQPIVIQHIQKCINDQINIQQYIHLCSTLLHCQPTLSVLLISIDWYCTSILPLIEEYDSNSYTTATYRDLLHITQHVLASQPTILPQLINDQVLNVLIHNIQLHALQQHINNSVESVIDMYTNTLMLLQKPFDTILSNNVLLARIHKQIYNLQAIDVSMRALSKLHSTCKADSHVDQPAQIAIKFANTLINASPYFTKQFVQLDGLQHVVKCKFLDSSSEPLLVDVLQLISQIARASADNYTVIHDAQLYSQLKNLLIHQSGQVRAKACNLIGNLFRFNDYFYTPIKQHGILPVLVQCCSDPDISVRKFATFGLGNSVYHSDTLYQSLDSSIPVLVHLLNDEMKISANTAGFFGNLCRSSNACNQNIIQSGVVPTLLNLTATLCNTDQPDQLNTLRIALFSLGNVAAHAECIPQFIKHNAVQLLQHELAQLKDAKAITYAQRVLYKLQSITQIVG